MPDQIQRDGEHVEGWSDTMRALTALLIAGLCACGPEAAPPPAPQANVAAATQACVHRPRNWPFEEPLHDISGLQFYEVEVKSDGAMLWNGEQRTPAELREFLDLVATLRPVPPLVLRAPPDSQCEAAERLRRHLDRHPLCRESACIEADRWAALGYPSFAEDRARSRAQEGR